jgi:hypothetical protein
MLSRNRERTYGYETRVEAVVLPDEEVNPSRTHANIRIEKGPMKGQEFSVPLELLAEI